MAFPSRSNKACLIFSRKKRKPNFLELFPNRSIINDVRFPKEKKKKLHKIWLTLLFWLNVHHLSAACMISAHEKSFLKQFKWGRTVRVKHIELRPTVRINGFYYIATRIKKVYPAPAPPGHCGGWSFSSPRRYIGRHKSCAILSQGMLNYPPAI